MRILLLFVLSFLVTHAAVVRSIAAESEPATQMAPYRIEDFGFEMEFSASKKTGKIREVKFSEVRAGSSAAKAGLRKGDYLVAVDGVAVVGMQHSEFPALLKRTVPAGQSVRYSFTIARGLRRKQSTVVFSLKSKEQKKEPN